MKIIWVGCQNPTFHKGFLFLWRNWCFTLLHQPASLNMILQCKCVSQLCHLTLVLDALLSKEGKGSTSSQILSYLILNTRCPLRKNPAFRWPSGFLLWVSGGSLQFEADEAAEEDSLFPMPPGQETSPESPLSESIFEIQPLNPILDDDCSSTRGFPTQESFTMASCASESHSYWVHTPIECTELDLQKFSSSASHTGAETLRGNTAESSGDRLELNVPFEVPSP